MCLYVGLVIILSAFICKDSLGSVTVKIIQNSLWLAYPEIMEID